jgi:hypothetical protein
VVETRAAMTPERWHAKKHDDLVERGLLNFEECHRCQRDRARCKSKMQIFDDPISASRSAMAQNRETNWRRPVVPYRCVWCPYWHVATIKTRYQVKRAEKQRRKHVTRELHPMSLGA